MESDRRSGFLFGRIFYDEPVSTSSENALSGPAGLVKNMLYRIGAATPPTRAHALLRQRVRKRADSLDRYLNSVLCVFHCTHADGCTAGDNVTCIQRHVLRKH